MERRTFMAMLTGGIVVAPLAAEAQTGGEGGAAGWLGFDPASAARGRVGAAERGRGRGRA